VGFGGTGQVDNRGRQPHIILMDRALSNPSLGATLKVAEAQEAHGRAGAAAPLASGERVGVTRLMLTDFRNYRETRLTLDTEPVVLTGPNGAGKTNLLEAVSFLAPGRGLRGARLTEIDRRCAAGCDVAREAATRGWAVAAEIATCRGTLRVGTGRDVSLYPRDEVPGGLSRDGDRRVVRIDGEPVRSQAMLAERLGVVWLTPPMDRLFIEGPGGRRRFLDRLVLALDPAHAARVGAYEQALRERARLLRTSFAVDRPADPSWLVALEAVMAAQGVAVAAARRDVVERLDRGCAESEGPFPRARLVLAGAVEDWLEEMPALAAEAKFAEALGAARRSDAVAGGAALGPHRSDLAVSLAQSGIAAEFASTGEQKAVLISILLAHAELLRALRGEPPLLLLDEIAAHLDASRRAALFEALERLASQVWLTGTDTALFAPLRHRAQFWSVCDGTLAATSF
jgi:DNA replication and repair protein RecF